MAEGDENKTEAATPRRREEARDSGQVAHSTDLTSAALLIVGLYVLSLTAHGTVTALASVMAFLLSHTGLVYDAQTMFSNDMRVSGPQMFKVLAPVMGAAAGSAVIVVGLQVGFHVSFQPLTPSLARLNPLKGFGRLFAGRNFMQMAMNVAKVTLLAATAAITIRQELPQVLTLSSVAFPGNFFTGAQMIFALTWRMAWSLLILAFADWIYQKWRLERDIRMTKQEIKDEAKRMEGDMETKGRRRQMARKMIMQRINRDVPRADVVITNPTELAIALKYNPEEMSAPRVVAKGAGYLAARIRQVAAQNGVPIMEKKSLAQAIYKTVEVGQEVPPHFYQAIAEILAYVYELAGKGMRRKAG